VIFDSTNQSAEGRSITECVFLDLFEDLGEIWVKNMRAVIVCVAKILDIFS